MGKYNSMTSLSTATAEAPAASAAAVRRRDDNLSHLDTVVC